MEPTASGTRAIDLTIEIAAPADAVWQALTVAEQLESWFPVNARVTPGVGGSIWVSWAGAATYESRITIWEPSRHLQLTDQPADPGAGQPVAVAQDFLIEGKGGSTVLRLVHSGFSADAQWDEMIDMMSSGWRYFLFNLRHYLEKHRGTHRRMVFTRRQVTDRSRTDAWPAILRALGIDPAAGEGEPFALALGDARFHGTVVQWKPPAHFAGTLDDLNDGLIFLELESDGPEWNAGFWISTYGIAPPRADQLQANLDAVVAELLPTLST